MAVVPWYGCPSVSPSSSTSLLLQTKGWENFSAPFSECLCHSSFHLCCLCSKHSSGCTAPTILGGQDKLLALVFSGTASSWLLTSLPAISFFPPLHRHPKGHHRRFLLGCDSAMACFCLCSCEVNTLLFHQRRANSKLPSCSLSSGSASSRAQPTLARHRQAVGGLPVQQLTSLPNSMEPSSVGLGVFVVQDPGLSSKEKTMREVIVLI